MLGTTQEDLEKLNNFHHRCVHTVLGITSQRQWEGYISSATVREKWGDVETIETTLVRRRLEWLGHLARMGDYRLPNICLFGWLPQTRPCRGPRRRWRGVVKRDLKGARNEQQRMVQQLRHKMGKWLKPWSQKLSDHQQVQEARRPGTEKNVVCSECGRCFRMECDKACHKCTAERDKPVIEQIGAVHCKRCRRWFKS